MSTFRDSAVLLLGVAVVLAAAWLVGFALAQAPHPPFGDPSLDPTHAVSYRDEAP